MRKGLLLYNPAAGRVPVRPFVRGIVHPLKDAGWQIEVAETLSGRHATQVARQASVEKYDAVFAIGGDGTVGQVASGLMNSETALAVLPAGTMNVWAAEVGIPVFDWLHNRALQQNAHLLANAKTYCVDVGSCNEQVFLLWAGIGLDAIIIHQLEPRPALPNMFRYRNISRRRSGMRRSGTAWICECGRTIKEWMDIIFWQSQPTSGDILEASPCFRRMLIWMTAKWTCGCSMETISPLLFAISWTCLRAPLRQRSGAAFAVSFCACGIRIYPSPCIWMASLCSVEPKQR